MIPAARRCGLLLPLVYIAARCNRSDDKSVDCDLRLISYMNKTKRASCQLYAVKNIRILTDILLRVFHILTESVPYIRLYPSIGGIAKRGPCIVGPRFVIPSIHSYKRIRITDMVPFKNGKLATRHPWYTDIFYSVGGTRRRRRAEPSRAAAAAAAAAGRDGT